MVSGSNFDDGPCLTNLLEVTVMPSWVDLDWQEFADVVAALGRLPQRPGSYAVRWAPRGRPAPIPRAFGVDHTGILFFGRTTIRADGLRGRLTDFCGAARGRIYSHAEGRRYADLHYPERGVVVNDLQIAWQVAPSPAEARDQELRWFDEYLGTHGELPPLNRQRG